MALSNDFIPRGLTRIEAARYIGISPPIFDQMVADGRMPAAKRINTRKVWDRHEVDGYFDGLPSDQAQDAASPDKWDFLNE